MEELAKILSNILRQLADVVAPGINVLSIEQIAERWIQKAGVRSYNKGYHPEWSKTAYPSVLCVGVNDTIAHGIPNDYVLQAGDLVSLDMGIVNKEGLCADAGLTVGVGTVSNGDERLLRYAKRTLDEAIKVVRPGVSVYAIGRSVENFAWRMGYVTNKYLSGHGIGKEMHEDPSIPNFDPTFEKDYPKVDTTLKAGQVICLEPFLTYKDRYGVKMSDGWTVKTRDGKKSAFFEHMVEVTNDGCKILTDHI